MSASVIARFSRLANLVLSVVVATNVCAQSPGEKTSIEIKVEMDMRSEVFAWKVEWSATGLDPDCSSYSLNLENWGEWDRADSLFLRNLNDQRQNQEIDGISAPVQDCSPTKLGRPTASDVSKST